MEVNLNKPPNPRAFPSDTSHGMTLRDYFAARVLQGELANGSQHVENDEDLVNYSYSIADLMLKERMKDENDNQF